MSESSGITDMTFKNICWRMQQLDCSLLSDCEDWWLSELFFTPGAHRIQLFDWFFSRLNFFIQKIAVSSQTVEESIRDILPIISALGFCKKKDYNIINGTASKSEQLKFWKEFLCILQIKTKILQDTTAESNSDRFSADPSGFSSVQCVLEEEYLKNCSLIQNCCYQVNINDLFLDHVNIFTSDVTKDVDCILSSSLPEDTSLSFQNVCSGSDNTHMDREIDLSDLFCDLFNKNSTTEFQIVGDEKIADDLNISSFMEFSRFINEFMVYFNSNLKPVLRSSDENFGKLGAQFSELQAKQLHIFQLLNNLVLIEESFKFLNDKTKSVESEKPNLLQPGSVLDEYCQIIQISEHL